MTPRHFIPFILCLLAAIPSQGTAADPPAQAVVRIKPHARPLHARLRVVDVADVDDKDAGRRSRLLDLDLADFEDRDQLTLTKTRIEVRLLLAGYAPDTVRVEGPEQFVVYRASSIELTDLSIEQAVFQQLCNQFHVDPADLQVKLVNPFIGSWLTLDPKAQYRVEVVPTPQLPLGRVTLTVRLLERDRVVAARGGNFDIGRRQTVVVAAASMDRSRVVAAEHIREEVRYVDAVVDELTVAGVHGRKVAVPLRPGEVVTLRHLAPETQTAGEILIRQGDAVRLTARKGALTVVVPMAEALQAGREGQAIRVRNTESNRIVTGRVVGRGEVEVLLR